MFAFLRPRPTLTSGEVQLSLRLMIWEAVVSGSMFTLGSGGFMAAYARALGANNLQIGVLAALPLIAQVVQLPAILAVERYRARKSIGLPALAGAYFMWIPIGAVPFLLDVPGAPAVGLVIATLAVRGLFGPVWVTASTSWLRDLVPRQVLGSYHGRRLAAMTAAMAIVGLGGSFFVQCWESVSSPDNAVLAYSFLLFGGTLVLGPVGLWAVSRARDP